MSSLIISFVAGLGFGSTICKVYFSDVDERTWYYMYSLLFLIILIANFIDV
jgi:hypothetical protein